jgi:hypothetical protein
MISASVSFFHSSQNSESLTAIDSCWSTMSTRMLYRTFCPCGNITCLVELCWTYKGLPSPTRCVPQPSSSHSIIEVVYAPDHFFVCLPFFWNCIMCQHDRFKCTLPSFHASAFPQVTFATQMNELSVVCRVHTSRRPRNKTGWLSLPQNFWTSRCVRVWLLHSKTSSYMYMLISLSFLLPCQDYKPYDEW